MKVILMIATVATLGLCYGVKIFKEPLEPVDNRFNGYDDTVPFQGSELLEIEPHTEVQVNLVYKMEENLNILLDFWKKPAVMNETIHVFVSPENLQKVKSYLARKKIVYRVVNDHVGYDVMMENAKHAGVLFNQYSGYDYTRYHGLAEIQNELRNLASQYSNIASLFTLGKTYEGRDQLGIKIKAPGNSNRKIFFFNCGIHAREWVTPATCMYMINEMLKGYSNNDNGITAMLNKMDWVIVPVLNADGYEYTWAHGGYRLWRKTRTTNARSTCKGTDPNRNFDIKWGGVGTSSNPCSDTYHGPNPFSEPCVDNLRKFILQHTNDLAGYIDVHSYSQLWMTPWGFTKTLPQDYNELARVSKIAVDALYKLYGTTYRYGPSSVIIYETSGASEDWVYENTWTSYAFGLELRDKGRYGFILPASQIIPTAEETFAAFKAMASAMRL